MTATMGMSEESTGMSTDTRIARVCFPFIGDSIGGSHISSLLLIQGLDRNRYDPLIVVHEEGPLAEYLRTQDIPFTLFPLPVYAGQTPKLTSITSAIVRNFPKIVNFINRKHIDIVHGNDIRINLTWGATAKLAGRRTVWHQRSLPYSSSTLWRTLGFFSNHAIHVSNIVADAMPSGLRVLSSTIADPVAPSKVMPLRNAAKLSISRELGFDPDTTLIGFVGRLIEWKRPDIFVKAAALLIRRDIPLKLAFVMVGSDREQMIPELKRSAASCGLETKIFFTGFRYPIEEWIGGMDLLMATSEREPFGRTLIESMMIGTPVVAARVGGHVDIVEHERTGLLVPPNDPEAFASAAHRILTDATFSAKLVEEAKTIAINRYSLGDHVLRIMAIYDSLL